MGNLLTVTGMNFGEGTPMVTLGGPPPIMDFVLVSLSQTRLEATSASLTGLPPGTYKLSILRAGSGGGKKAKKKKSQRSLGTFDVTLGAIGSGSPGPPGADGEDGEDGMDGADGATGPAGPAAGTDRPDPPCFDNTNRYVACSNTAGLNGTVTDTVTGLIWLQDAACLGSLNWAVANQAAAAADGAWGGELTDGSRPGDWRLPTKGEWEATIARAVAPSPMRAVTS